MKQPKMVIKSFKILVPHIWNLLPEHMKAKPNFIKFKEYINQWFGPIYKCNFCAYNNKQVRESYEYDLEFDPFTENGFQSFVFSFLGKYVNIVFIYHSCN